MIRAFGILLVCFRVCGYIVTVARIMSCHSFHVIFTYTGAVHQPDGPKRASQGRGPAGPRGSGKRNSISSAAAPPAAG